MPCVAAGQLRRVIALLDANVLVALFDPAHLHHEAPEGPRDYHHNAVADSHARSTGGCGLDRKRR